MLEGHLFLQPAGYLEGERDVIRLAPSVEEVKKQEGYITCQPRKEGDGLDERLPLHFCLRVIPAQVREGKQPRPATFVPVRCQVQVDIGSVCCCMLTHCPQASLQSELSTVHIMLSFKTWNCSARPANQQGLQVESSCTHAYSFPVLSSMERAACMPPATRPCEHAAGQHWLQASNACSTVLTCQWSLAHLAG